MERKLLSLPSFFVLLLIAGIAFLATPVVDVQAAVPGAPTTDLIDPPGTAAVPSSAANALTASGMTNVLVLKFPNTAVKVTTAPGVTPAVSARDGFGVEDLTVTVTNTLADPDESDPLAASKISLTPIKSTTALPGGITGPAPADDQWFIVGVEIPENEIGSITVAVKIFHASLGSAFHGTGTTDDYAGTAELPATGNVVYYNTHNPLPTVTIKPLMAEDDADTVDARTSAGLAAFPVRFTITDPESDPVSRQDRGFSATPTFTAASIDIAGGTVTDVADVVAVTGDANSYTVTAYVQASTSATSVIIGVEPGVVTDKDGGMNAAIPTTKSGSPPTLTNNMAKEVMIDTVRPQAIVMVPDGDHAIGVGFTATFTFTETTGTPPVTTTLNRSALSDDGLEADGITVSGGALTNLRAKHGSFKAYEATVTPEAEAEEVVITVKENAVTDLAGNGSLKGMSRTIETGFTPGVVTTGTGLKNPLTGNRVGFSFPVNLPVPNSDNTNRHLVLAKSPAADAGFTAAVSAIDIDDGTWQDLRHFFVGREGGTIDLIGPTGRKVRSLVISEVMWGNDDGLDPASNSQWIELYNTTGAAIDGTWTLEFSNKSKGRDMLANETDTTTAAPVVDKLSTWKKVGNVWEWRIEDKAGGSHGESGKSTPLSAGSPGSPNELVSMQRKIDYAKVQKTDHNDDTAKNRTEQLKDFPNGAAAGGWEASKEHGDMLPYRKGTPGSAPVIRTFDKTGVPRGSVVFNEIANRSNEDHDWIELYNKSGSAKKINGWELSLVQLKDGKNDDAELFTFTSDNDINVPAKGYLLIVNTKPKDTRLEGGYNLTDPGSSERGDAESLRPYYVTDKLNIPKENFLLILRNGNDKTGTHEKIEDIAGHNPSFPDGNINTEVWPLRSWTLGAKNDLVENNTKTWVRDQGKAVFHGDEWKSDGGFTGVGIKRQYDSGDDYTSGTPGYANNAVQNEVKSDGLTETNPVIISEIMFATVGRAPQWIELHNPSHTQAVNLNKWVLEVFNYRGDELEVNDYAELVLPEVRIQPNQTVLIVSRETSRMSGSDEFPDDRIIGIWNETDLRKAFDMQHQNDAILSSEGFHLKLSDSKKTPVDAVGNIDANRRNNDEPAWTLPDGNSEDGGRSSMVRDIEGAANDGTVRDAWRDADFVDSSKINTDANELYYGDPDDVGTPGYTPGGVLPVQLSSFYSKRNDAGAVVITWSTESELDNAGFNLLRSSSRSGEFTKINAQLIPGAGTTGEKNTYTWTDTGAHPNVVYYYQIEDVSLDGAHRTLRTTRLRGHVGAHGKLTTTWGVLKSRD